MAANIDITKGYTFGATEQVTSTKLHTLVDSATATISGIENSELNQITEADKVSGSAITDLIFFNDALVSFDDTPVYH
jgi:hypothetical protein